MSFASGTFATVDALHTAIVNACVAAGWTATVLSSASGAKSTVLAKGSCYQKLTTNTRTFSYRFPGNTGDSFGTPAAVVYLGIQAANGFASDITDVSRAASYIGGLAVATGSPPSIEEIAGGDYDIHVKTNPDMVWVAVRYAGTKYQHLAFGQEATPIGTGNWHFASLGNRSTNVSAAMRTNMWFAGVNGNITNALFSAAPFYRGNFGNNNWNLDQNGSFHGSLGATEFTAGWSLDSDRNFSNGQYTRSIGASPSGGLLTYQPNIWNNEAVLLPLRLWAGASSSMALCLCTFEHVRLLRNDYIDDGFVIDLSPDKWKVYPQHRKNATTRNGGSNIDHSGTFALAVRYDGP